MADLNQNQLYSGLAWNNPAVPVLPVADGALDSIEEYQLAAHLFATGLESTPTPTPSAEVTAAPAGLGILWHIPIPGKRGYLRLRGLFPLLRMAVRIAPYVAPPRRKLVVPPPQTHVALRGILPAPTVAAQIGFDAPPRVAVRMVGRFPAGWARVNLGLEHEEDVIAMMLGAYFSGLRR